ncbi:MAG TPA: carbon-nitrogen hydrolase family protein [Anaerolineae bacterium]|jgi:predicted amidohydrolase
MITLAAAQFDPHLGDVAYNLAHMCSLLAGAVNKGAQLLVFPECAITGYNFAALEDARAIAATGYDSSVAELTQACHEMNVYLITGTLRAVGKDVYNSALLIGPEGLIGCYDKAHLPLCGVDKYTTHGKSGFHVYDTPLGRIGMLICYDLRFPEAARTLALRGADIIALPTNWPSGADTAPEFMVRARAFENRVFVVACNRIGSERGASYIGRSCIAAPDGKHLADASAVDEQVINARVNVDDARQKRLVITPGEFEMDFFNDRRPELYEQELS